MRCTLHNTAAACRYRHPEHVRLHSAAEHFVAAACQSRYVRAVCRTTKPRALSRKFECPLFPKFRGARLHSHNSATSGTCCVHDARARAAAARRNFCCAAAQTVRLDPPLRLRSPDGLLVRPLSPARVCARDPTPARLIRMNVHTSHLTLPHPSRAQGSCVSEACPLNALPTGT